MPKRTTHRSTAGKKLYAVRDKKTGKFDVQTYERAHGQDVKRRAKKEKRGFDFDLTIPIRSWPRKIPVTAKMMDAGADFVTVNHADLALTHRAARKFCAGIFVAMTKAKEAA